MNMVFYFESYIEITSPLWYATYYHSSELINEFTTW